MQIGDILDRGAIAGRASAPTKRQALEQLSLRYVRPKLAAALDAENLIVEFPLLFEMSDFACRADLVSSASACSSSGRCRIAP